MRSKPFTVHCIQKSTSSNTNLKVHFLLLLSRIYLQLYVTATVKFLNQFFLFCSGIFHKVLINVTIVASAFTCHARVVYLFTEQRGMEIITKLDCMHIPRQSPSQALVIYLITNNYYGSILPYSEKKTVSCTGLIILVPFSGEGSQTP